jgi:hypothetical protein
MKLIPQARKWYRMFSVQALMLIGAIEATAQGVAAIYGQKMLDVAIPLLNVTGSEKSDLGKLEVKIGTDYVRYDRLQDALKPVIDKLSRIEDALAHKQDR